MKGLTSMNGEKRAKFNTGERVPHGGTYRIIHTGHRLPGEVSLLAGAVFPRCSKCNQHVEFEAVRYIPRWEEKKLDFRVVVYELPVVEAEGEGDVPELMAG